MQPKAATLCCTRHSSSKLGSALVCKRILAKGICGIDRIGGLVESNVYECHIGIPSVESGYNVEVLEMPDEESSYDVIIGMDIIGKLDFAITHPGGNTKFTNERPSKHDLDFTKE